MDGRQSQPFLFTPLSSSRVSPASHFTPLPFSLRNDMPTRINVPWPIMSLLASHTHARPRILHLFEWSVINCNAVYHFVSETSNYDVKMRICSCGRNSSCHVLNDQAELVFVMFCNAASRKVFLLSGIFFFLLHFLSFPISFTLCRLVPEVSAVHHCPLNQFK